LKWYERRQQELHTHGKRPIHERTVWGRRPRRGIRAKSGVKHWQVRGMHALYIKW
jgi:hypothetical protein